MSAEAISAEEINMQDKERPEIKQAAAGSHTARPIGCNAGKQQNAETAWLIIIPSIYCPASPSGKISAQKILHADNMDKQPQQRKHPYCPVPSQYPRKNFGQPDTQYAVGSGD